MRGQKRPHSAIVRLKKAEKIIEAQNEEIHYLKTKAYQLIATNKNLKKHRIESVEYSHKNANKPINIPAKYTDLKAAKKRIAGLDEEIHYVKTKIYQLITTNKTLKTELNTKNMKRDESNRWKRISRRKPRTQPISRNDH